jgi:hypothetical protein
MIDTLKKQQQVVARKQPIIKTDASQDLINIVFLLDYGNIVYIGKTKIEPLVYAYETSKRYHCTDFYSEVVSLSKSKDYLAELILTIQPLYNKKVPSSDKFISSNRAKKDYRISKREFKKVLEEYGGHIFLNNLLFLEKKVFDDVFAMEPYHENMPRINGREIILCQDYIDLNRCSTNGYKTLFDEHGNEVEALVNFEVSWQEVYEKYIHNENNSFIVTKLIDSKTFQAVRHRDNATFLLDAEDMGKIWDYTNNDWIDIEYIIKKLKEQKRNENEN